MSFLLKCLVGMKRYKVLEGRLRWKHGASAQSSTVLSYMSHLIQCCLNVALNNVTQAHHSTIPRSLTSAVLTMFTYHFHYPTSDLLRMRRVVDSRSMGTPK
jgi:hypothetical protein